MCGVVDFCVWLQLPRISDFAAPILSYNPEKERHVIESFGSQYFDSGTFLRKKRSSVKMSLSKILKAKGADYEE